MKILKSVLKIFIFSFTLLSCSSDDIDTRTIEITPDTKFENGFFVSAEGRFGNNDGSISFINEDLSSTTNFAYNKVNGVQLGGLIQSVAFNGENAYIILNDVNTIVVIDRQTFKKKAVVTSKLKNPRYMTFSGGKGYITNWGDGNVETDDYVAVLNLETNKIENETISLANGVEQIISKDNKLFVTHKGGFTSNNIVSVVDLSANNKVEEIIVKDNPDELFFTDNGNLVVLSEGKPEFDDDFNLIGRSTSAISIIDLNIGFEVELEIDFPENENASLMSYENGKIYYYSNNKVFEIPDTATELAANEQGIEVGNIYGMNVINNTLYTVSFAFTTFSEFKAIDIETKSTKFSSSVGLGSSKIYFSKN